ncbi:hypothetical protein GQ53DRAFT_667704 [Thozetella sp. PMI_491]|nr:hypothetical protein GQ53DRAFT_667704 [Thozetella sp. PMI_491]
MEGTLVVPPERGTIIGRALWKPRYVVIGPAVRESPGYLDRSLGSSGSRSRLPPGVSNDAVYLSIYKSKEDLDPIQQHAISSITDCQVQMAAHRKQGPVLPTLVINISPDPATDKLRKRRSSRTAGLTTTKETTPSTLWFRPGGEDHHNLHDWARFLQPLIQPNMPDRTPKSPITPSSPAFVNPFSPRQREPSDQSQRPGSGNPNSRAPLQHKNSSQTYSSAERSRQGEAPSLRSKRSDISSNPSHIGFQNYTVVHPTDLPSPATTVGEYQGEFIEGWTSAQGRSSTLSSPIRGSIRGRDSIGSQMPAPPIHGMVDSSSPPGPRETILDRAFQMRYIPGSDRDLVGEGKLSSLARFDALMREVDQKRKTREAEEAKLRAAEQPDGLKSAWDLDDDSDEEQGAEDSDSEDEPVGELEQDLADRFMMPSKAQQALNFIAGRADQAAPPPRSPSARGPLSYDHETLMALSSNSGSSHLRPQTGYSTDRPGFAQRKYSQPQLAGHKASRMGLASPTLDVLPSAAEDGGSVGPLLHRSATEKRHSTSSAKRHSTSSLKRLSFTEFTKRLSNTSSLLLVQTNTSNASSRASAELDFMQQQQSAPKGMLGMRSSQPSTPLSPGQSMSDKDRENIEARCGFRGSVGVLGKEGSFL